MAITADDVKSWQAAAGRSQSATEVLELGNLRRFAAAVGEDMDVERQPPSMAHWAFFLAVAPDDQIGEDGHPRRGDFLPPITLPRRMYAGARITFQRDLKVGVKATRTRTITEVTEKTGRTGTLVFVSLREDFADKDGLCIRQENDIVFRALAQPGEAAPKPAAPPAKPVWRRTVTPDPVMLFKYSAVTFNGHRIHYDRPYTMGVEGYPGLVVHGPLTAALLMDLCRREKKEPLATFNFRAQAPLFDTAPFTVNGAPKEGGKSWAIWAETPEGGVAMLAEATFA